MSLSGKVEVVKAWGWF